MHLRLGVGYPQIAPLSTIFLDGAQVDASAGMPCRIGSGGNTIWIGVRDAGAFLNGAVDDVRVYDRALHPDLIKAIAAE